VLVDRVVADVLNGPLTSFFLFANRLLWPRMVRTSLWMHKYIWARKCSDFVGAEHVL
jgi:hypothetical protein